MILKVEELIENIANEIQNFADVAVVGLSGGADSTLTAILCARALGKENVYGISMPYDYEDVITFNSNSKNVAEKLGINHFMIPIDDIADTIDGRVSGFVSVSSTNQGNSRSRARMCVLYGISHSLNGRVIGTGNLSENYIGYDTKGGDALADIFPIGELFKSEVYQLLDYFRDNGTIGDENINRVPSAGLKEGQTDEDDLGYSYDEMEKVIRFRLGIYEKPFKGFDEDVIKFVIERHFKNKHKHEAQNVVFSRKYCD